MGIDILGRLTLFYYICNMKKWSTKHKECVKCNTKEIRHKAKGLCLKCYEKNRDIDLQKKRLHQIEYRKKNIEKVRKSQRDYKAKRKKEIHTLLGCECIKCGFKDSRALQIDHINGGGYTERKQYNKSPSKYYKNILKSIINKENKYQLLCANCNWIKRYENNEIKRK